MIFFIYLWSEGIDNMRRTAFLSFILMLGLFQSFSGPVRMPAGYFSNPVICGDVPDPSIIRFGGTYYATGTSSEWAPLYPIFESKDLVNWKQIGSVFNEPPAWTTRSFWAPELFCADGKVYCYYTARRASDGISCVVNCNNRTYLLSSGGSYYKSSALDDYLTDSCVYQIAYMLLLDDKNNCTAFSKRILENYEIETVQVFDENKYTENIKLLLSEINGKIDGSYFYTNNDAEIYAEKQKNCMAVKADFGDLSILLIHGKTDCNNIPKSWLDTDILVINGSIENLGLVNASVTVISDEEHRGNIYLRAYNNGKIQIGRENGWLN